MGPAIFGVLFIVLATAAIAIALQYSNYLRWPCAIWKKRLVAHRDDLNRKLAGLLGEDTEKMVQQVKVEFLERHLSSVGTNALINYPGIGQMTVDRLQNSGFRNLYDLRSGRFELIDGIGAKRAGDIRTAVRMLSEHCCKEFAEGKGAEAMACRKKIDDLRSTRKAREIAIRAEVSSLRKAIGETDSLIDAAKSITFTNYLFQRSVGDLLEDLIARPLPAARGSYRIESDSEATPAMAKLVSDAVGRYDRPFRGDTGQSATPNKNEVVASKHPALPKMRAITAVAMLVAKADGHFAAAERKRIRDYLGKRFGHDDLLARHIDPLIEKMADTRLDEQKILNILAAGTDSAERSELYQLAESIADSCGRRSKDEEQLLGRLAAAFGITSDAARPTPPTVPIPKPYPKEVLPVAVKAETLPRVLKAPGIPQVIPVKAEPIRQKEDPRVLLDLAVGIKLSPELIRRKYHQIADKLDPTRLGELGPEFQNMAAEKRARVRAAAESLIAEFGQPLEIDESPPSSDLRKNDLLDDIFR